MIYLGVIELCLLSPTIIYRIFRLFFIKTRRLYFELFKDIMSVICYLSISIMVYNGLKSYYISFELCIILVLTIFILILEYLRIATDLISIKE